MSFVFSVNIVGVLGHSDPLYFLDYLSQNVVSHRNFCEVSSITNKVLKVEAENGSLCELLLTRLSSGVI